MNNLQDSSGSQQPLAPPGTGFLQQEIAGQGGGESTELFNWAVIGSYAGFILHSIGRHKLLFLLVWLGIVAFSFGAAAAFRFKRLPGAALTLGESTSP